MSQTVIERADEILQQNAVVSRADEILAHHGVKGMKWGVRKDGSISSTTSKKGKLPRKPTDVTVRQKPGQFAKATGGAKQTAHNDAVTVLASRQLAKRSTTDSLSTKQLKDAVTRMNLEQQYHTLAKKSDRRSRGRKFVKALFSKETRVKVVKANKAAAKVGAALASGGA